MKRFKDLPPPYQRGDDEGATWMIQLPNNECLRIIASWGEGWDHVSVSLVDRIPTWGEMELVKRLFFKDHEIAIEYHVPPDKHINIHPNCLHLWRPQREKIPLPPRFMV